MSDYCPLCDGECGWSSQGDKITTVIESDPQVNTASRGQRLSNAGNAQEASPPSSVGR